MMRMRELRTGGKSSFRFLAADVELQWKPQGTAATIGIRELM